MGYFNNTTLNIPSISWILQHGPHAKIWTEFLKILFDLLMGTSPKSNALIFRYGWSLWTHYLPVQFYLLSRISYLSFLTSKTKKMKSILFSFSFARIEDDLYLGWTPNLSFSLHEQKYRLHTRRPNSSAAQSSTNCSQPGPQFVVVGGIWVPPQDYAAAAAAAAAAQPSADIKARSSTIYTPVASVPSPHQQNNKRPLVNGPRCNGNSEVSPKSASPSTSSSSQTTTASPPFWLFSTVCYIYGLVCRFFCYLFLSMAIQPFFVLPVSRGARTCVDIYISIQTCMLEIFSNLYSVNNVIGVQLCDNFGTYFEKQIGMNTMRYYFGCLVDRLGWRVKSLNLQLTFHK